MTKPSFPCLLLALAVALAAGGARAAAPEVISYQGLLTDDQGVVAEDGQYGLRFEVYDAPAGGTLLFRQSLQVTVVDGLYNVLLSTNQHPSGATLAEVFANDITYMAVVIESGPGIGSEVELSPRQQIASVPYALTAGATSIPAGVIAMWSGSIGEIPEGWALCDGQNQTPDLRGRFIVGHDPGDGDYDTIADDSQQTNSGGSGIGEKAHALTLAELAPHDHGGGDHDHGVPNVNMLTSGDATSSRVQGGGGLIVRQNSRVDPSGAVIALAGGGQAHENRPPYYVLAFIMKL